MLGIDAELRVSAKRESLSNAYLQIDIDKQSAVVDRASFFLIVAGKCAKINLKTSKKSQKNEKRQGGCFIRKGTSIRTSLFFCRQCEI